VTTVAVRSSATVTPEAIAAIPGPVLFGEPATYTDGTNTWLVYDDPRITPTQAGQVAALTRTRTYTPPPTRDEGDDTSEYDRQIAAQGEDGTRTRTSLAGLAPAEEEERTR